MYLASWWLKHAVVFTLTHNFAFPILVLLTKSIAADNPMYYFEILKELFNQKVDYLIVGGLAVNLYGVPRVTQDIDIIISFDKENIFKLNKVLSGLGYVPRLPGIDPKELADPVVRENWIANKNLKAFSFYHRKDSYKAVDIVLVHPLDFPKAFQNKTIKKAQGISINLVGIDDLITMKSFSGRQQDLSDIELLKKIQQYQEEGGAHE
jgi:hypothetical protein